MDKTAAGSIDEYMSGMSSETRAALEELRALVREVAPEATETISYGIPTFDLNGKHLVHFAGYAHHIGFYPTPSGMDAFDDELAVYKRSKGTVQFPLGQPLPVALIRRMVEFRVAEVTGRA